jgi:hypothetical protein
MGGSGSGTGTAEKRDSYSRVADAVKGTGDLLRLGFVDELRGGAKNEPALFAVHALKMFGEEAQACGFFFAETPESFGLGFRDVKFSGRLIIFDEELIERNFEGARQFLESFDGRDGAGVFQAREVTAKQAGAGLDIALGEVLGFTELFESFAYDHGGSLQYFEVLTQ